VDLQGKGAVVAGGGSGLGAASARALADAGCVVTVVDRDEDAGHLVAKEIGGSFAAADVRDEAALESAIESAALRAPLRIAVSCAGIAVFWGSRLVDRDGKAHSLGPYRELIEINLIGTFNVMRFSAAAMARHPRDGEEEGGVIVNTASLAAFEGQVTQVGYAASKGGVVAMTLPAARDLAPHGIRVCTIAPGIFATPLVGRMPDDHKGALAANVVHPRRPGDPDEFGQLVRSICENPYLNGEVIRLDGALRMGRK
jgi:NAD(P)-dependent dehydrogenase (short-subunit alcohol dehydrogenase family)